MTTAVQFELQGAAPTVPATPLRPIDYSGHVGSDPGEPRPVTSAELDELRHHVRVLERVVTRLAAKLEKLTKEGQ